MNLNPSITHRKEIFAEIVLGSPRARCARFGICEAKIISPEDWEKFIPQTPRVVKSVIVKDDSTSLHLIFPFNGMTLLTWEYFFASGIFRIDAPKRLPKDLLSALDLEYFVIKKGNYPCLMQQDGGIIVTVEHDKEKDREIPGFVSKARSR